MSDRTREQLLDYIREIEERLELAEDTLEAIRNNEVDAVVVKRQDGEDLVYTLEGADKGYRLMVQEMAEGAATIAEDGTILFANEQLAAILGVPLERVIGAAMQEFACDPDRERLSSLIWEGVREGAKSEICLVRPDGELPVYISMRRLNSEAPRSGCAIITDLSSRRHSEEIIAAGNLARSILEQTADATLVVDTKGRITHASRAAERLAGSATVFRQLDDIFRLWLDGGNVLTSADIIDGLHMGEVLKSVQVTISVRGQEHHMLLSASRLNVPEKGLAGFIVTLTDISELKVTEAELRHREAQERARASELQALMEAMPAGVLIAHDPECVDLFANRTAKQLLGAPEDYSWRVGRSNSHYELKRDGKVVPLHELPLQVAARTGKTVVGQELEVVFRDGSPSRHLFVNAVPLLNEHGKSEGAVATFIDVSERKRFEERLRESQRLESVGLLAGGIAHDFNNLLVGVIGGASLAKELIPRDNEAVELLDRVVQTGEQAAHLTRQLLAYAGKGRFVLDRINLSELVKDISNVLKPSISSKTVLKLEVAADLPSIEADTGQIQQVFMNLALNAAESIGEGGGTILVRTGVEEVTEKRKSSFSTTEVEPGQYVFLEVRDNGSGMDEATQAKIFEPFFTTKFLGRGLGLAAVSGIIRGHKGAIEVHSAPGKGSCFRVLFPAGPVVTMLPKREPQPSSPAPARIKILVVDDEDIVRTVAKASLELRGYDVILAENGKQSIDVFRRHADEIGLVVLDLSMPGMDGSEVLPRLQEIRPSVPVLVSSGYSESEAMRFFEGKRVAGFIQKPYSAPGLVEKVNRTVEELHILRSS